MGNKEKLPLPIFKTNPLNLFCVKACHLVLAITVKLAVLKYTLLHSVLHVKSKLIPTMQIHHVYFRALLSKYLANFKRSKYFTTASKNFSYLKKAVFSK